MAGDVAYGLCHQYLAESPTPELRAQWRASIEKVKALKPKVVIPSHMQEGEGYGVVHLAEPAEYINSFEKWLKTAKTWEELENLAKEAYPNRTGDHILRSSAQAFFTVNSSQT